MNENDLKEKLDIFIITYNRADSLEKTFEQILAYDSPIKNLTITVFDNNSTDDTCSVVHKLQSNHPNLKYCKNEHNIGGNANIVKAFLSAKKDYVWILCDDDKYDWASFDSVKEGITENADAIIVSDIDYPKAGLANLYAQTTFLPGVIYKTSNIDETVIENMFYNVPNMFPHLALSSKLINENKKFKIIPKGIVIYGFKEGELLLSKTYIRGCTKDDLHPFRRYLSYYAGYANSLHLVKDKKQRKIIAAKRRFFTNLNSSRLFFQNEKYCNNSLYNLFCIFLALDIVDRFWFIVNLILFYTIYRIIYFDVSENYNIQTSKTVKTVYIRLFYFIKTR
ncbi:MAG: glycosyltransferase, partial [Candidatus Gastranaerophilales bacterium]|nr:glycosyltransferase [Candidatus Gastranaerophilales bacterium]